MHLDQFRDESPFVTDKAGKPLEKNPLKDLRVRQAISKAINRQAIVERVMEGPRCRPRKLMPPAMFGSAPGLKPDDVRSGRREEAARGRPAIPTASP